MATEGPHTLKLFENYFVNIFTNDQGKYCNYFKVNAFYALETLRISSIIAFLTPLTDALLTLKNSNKIVLSWLDYFLASLNRSFRYLEIR